MLWALKYLYALQLTLFLLCGCAENKAEELVVAASDGDLSTVRRLLDQGVNVESRALDGLTPLKPERTAHAALQRNSIGILVSERVHGTGHRSSLRRA